MTEKYNKMQLRAIAEECSEFEHVISAMGYGYSLLNVSPDNYVRQCNDCIHWADGSCSIFQGEIKNWV